MKFVYAVAIFGNSMALGFNTVQANFLWATISLIFLLICITAYKGHIEGGR